MLLGGAWHSPPARSLPGIYPEDHLAHTVDSVMLVAPACVSSASSSASFFFQFSPLSRMLSNRSERTQIRPHSRSRWTLAAWFRSPRCDLECYMGWHRVRVRRLEGGKAGKGEKSKKKKNGHRFKKRRQQEKEGWQRNQCFIHSKSLTRHYNCRMKQ